jgi:hypothetical protein
MLWVSFLFTNLPHDQEYFSAHPIQAKTIIELYINEGKLHSNSGVAP